jgi:hypothetical protein
MAGGWWLVRGFIEFQFLLTDWIIEQKLEISDAK